MEFADLYRRHWRYVVAVAARVLGWGGDPDGLAQEAFVHVWRWYPEWPTAPDRYVRRVLVRQVRREARRRRWAALPAAPFTALPGGPPDAPARPDRGGSVADLLPPGLHPTARAVALLTVDEGCTGAEAAARLGVHPQTVKHAWKRIRQAWGEVPA